MRYKAYTNYQVEDNLQLLEEIHLQAIRKKNSRRSDAPWVQFYKQSTRHQIETVFSRITQRFPRINSCRNDEGISPQTYCFYLCLYPRASISITSNLG